MNLFHKSIFALAATALSSFDSHHPFIGGVDGAIWTEVLVECLPEDPSVCYGMKTMTTPSPSIHCPDPPSEETCAPVYVGGWGWRYEYVAGLEQGIDDFDVIEDAKTGFEVMVKIEDDETACSVEVGDDKCSMCSAEGCGPGEVKFDCTNVENGRASDECSSADAFFYPFLVDANGISEKNCPGTKPQAGSSCSTDVPFCEYEYKNMGCTLDQYYCAPTEFYFCLEDKWLVATSFNSCGDQPLESCDPNNKPCPAVKPESGTSCVDDGHQVGLSCSYEYVNTSCNEEEDICSPTEFYTCSEDGWAVAMPSFYCGDQGFPSNFGNPCDPNDMPCPAAKPERGTLCVDDGHQVGLSCNYEYVNTSCNEEEDTCEPTEFYTCGEDGWMVAMADIYCTGGYEGFSSKFLEPCDPNNMPCPAIKPEGGTSCVDDGHQVGLSCNYEYINTSCNEEEDICSPTEYYTCREDGWAVAMPFFNCGDQGFPSNFGNPCDPNNMPCPVVKPEGGTSCVDDGHQVGLSCDYEYVNTSCNEEEDTCEPTEFYTCGEDGWTVAMPFVSCGDQGFPSNFYEPCDPQDVPCPATMPEIGWPCVRYGHQVGQSCDYEYINFSCDEGEESCIPTQNVICDEQQGWYPGKVAVPFVDCGDEGFPSHFLEPCD